MTGCALSPRGAYPGQSTQSGSFRVRDVPRASSEYVAALNSPFATSSPSAVNRPIHDNISWVHWLCIIEGTSRYLHPFTLLSAGHSAALIRSCPSHELWLQLSFEYYVPMLQLARCRLYKAPREIRPPKSGSCTRGARTVRLGAFEKALRSLLSHLPTPGTAWYSVASWSFKTVAVVKAALRSCKHACSRSRYHTFDNSKR